MSRPLLLASLGNPGPKFELTRHSAGHTLLHAVARLAGAPQMERSRRWETGFVTSHDDMVFWSSSDFMNHSGRSTAAAWHTFLERQPLHRRDHAHLVVFHDELELNVGRYSFKTNIGASPRGHNGLKSLLSMPGMRQTEFSRVGIGIGPRPLERDPRTVAHFVLEELSRWELNKIEHLAPLVLDELKELRALVHPEEEAQPGDEIDVAEAERERREHELELQQQDDALDLEHELVLGPRRDARDAKYFVKRNRLRSSKGRTKAAHRLPTDRG